MSAIFAAVLIYQEYIRLLSIFSSIEIVPWRNWSSFRILGGPVQSAQQSRPRDPAPFRQRRGVLASPEGGSERQQSVLRQGLPRLLAPWHAEGLSSWLVSRIANTWWCFECLTSWRSQSFSWWKHFLWLVDEILRLRNRLSLLSFLSYGKGLCA